ncbi:hypothetical protein ACGFNU_42590 [Spirillospora sp. NPDC048911]
MPRCLIITNDLPPRRGGIEPFEAAWSWDRSYERLRDLLAAASPTVRA